MSESLFRKEVLEQRQTTPLGVVLLLPRISHRVYVIFAATMALAICVLLFTGNYARKARINGWLVPQEGVVQVYAPQMGIVAELFVKEGAVVREGDRLLTLSGELRSKELGATHAQIVEGLRSRQRSLESQLHELKRLAGQQRTSLRHRLDALNAERRQLQQEIDLRKKRVELAMRSEERLKSLVQSGAVSEQQMQTATEATLEEYAKVHELERELAANRQEQVVVQGDLDDLPLRSQNERAEIERQIAQVQQELAEAELRRAFVVTAPVGGTITAVQAELGGRPPTDVPLLSIVPTGATLKASLYCPSHAIGFVDRGQEVLLRYHAFPYQKFGQYKGVVADISRTAVNPGALPPQLAGLTGLVGSGEPVYRVDVAIEKQEVKAYGKAMPLHPGMKLEADVVVERRRLVEWMLDPLYTVTGRGSE